MLRSLGCVAGLLSLGAVAAAADAPRAELPPLAIHMHAFINENYLEAEVVAAPAIFPAAQSDVQLGATGPAGPFHNQRLTLDAQRGSAVVRLDGRDLPDGRITLAATAVHRPTGKRVTVNQTLDRPLRPVWLNTTEGLSHAVPAPWTALEVDGSAVKPWGRVYRFDHSLLPTAITARAASLLASPARLVAKIAGQTVVWPADAIDYRQRGADVVVLAGQGSAAGLTLRGTTRIEYDGMLRADLVLAPQAGPVNVESLTLEIPLRPEHARYLYHFPGRWGSIDNCGFLPPAGWKHPFKPMLWLGDEDRGLAWFCESDRNWLLSDPQQAITIDREAAAVTLRCHLIDHSLKIDAPLEYTFGLQATPVKEPEKTVWDYRIVHHGRYGLERDPAGPGASITYPGRGHLRAEQGTIECWYRPAFDSEADVPLGERKHPENRNIITIRWKNGDILHGTNCGLYYNGQAAGPVVWSRRDGKVLLNPRAKLDWKAGVWHHLALTWSDKVRLYVDGQLASVSPNTGLIPAAPDEATIEVGGGPVAAAIDDVRILSVARVPQLSDAPAQPDAETLLLDGFENYETAGATPPGAVHGRKCFGPGRFGQAFVIAPGQTQTQLDVLAEQGVRTVCFHEHWSPYQAYPAVTDENRPKLLSLVRACHEQKVNLLLYMSREMADNAPEWELYHDEALVAPRHGGYKRQPAQTDWYACWRSPWKDFCLYHLARLLDEIGHDGWYLDGPEWPQACTNRHHGCGYVGPDGKVRPTYDIFATREFMQRLYVLTRQRRPQAQLNVHNSTVMTIPTLAWATSSWDGEHFDALKSAPRILDTLPMDAFRTEFMGRQWGVPAEFLVYENRPFRSQDLLAYTLLHGVLIRPSGDEALARTSALWKVYDRFPFAQATMYPYWDAKSPVHCEPPGTYVTAYQRPGEGLLLFISNLSEEDAQASIKLDLAQLHLSEPLTAWDALTEARLPLGGASIELPLGRWQYRVLRVAPEAVK